MRSVPVIMYHALENSEHPANCKSQGEHLYVVDTKKFEEHMKYLHLNGITSISMEQLLSGRELPECSVVITFDDGHVSNVSLALDILKKYNMKATFFITTGWINTDNFMTEEQIRKLRSKGMDIGTHGVSHQFFDDLDEDNARFELTESKAVLERILNERVNIFSAPGGRVNSNIIELLQTTGYKALFTSKIGLYQSTENNFFDIPRIDIKKDIDFSDFISIVTKNQRYIRKLAIKSNYLIYAKRILGNRLYVKLRSIALRVTAQG